MSILRCLHFVEYILKGKIMKKKLLSVITVLAGALLFMAAVSCNIDVPESGTETGANGVFMVWKGELPSAPENPELYWAYFNTADGCSYIWSGTKWDMLSAKGATGTNGSSIVWKGELAAAPENPETNWAYFNTTDGCSYIWSGTKWEKLSEKGATGSIGETGANGISIVWKGELAEAPANPETNWAYFSTTDGCSYIWSGTKWDKLSEKGATGSIGETGANGISILWKGEFAEAPENPETNWAYYNTTDGCSYIYDGEKWNLLAKGNNNSSSGVVIEGTTLTGWENPEGDITIPSEVTSIGDEAFAGCSGLTSITIPDSVTTIGSYAFSDCENLTSVNYEGTLEQWLNISFSDSKSNPLFYAHHLYIDDSELTDLIIPNNVTNIKGYSFYGCSGLTSVTIPDSVTGIEKCAFTKCSGLTSVIIGNNVTSIGASAFSGCSGLTSITIPGSVTSIEDSVFYNCDGLTSITIPDSVTKIKTRAFKNCSGLTSITIPGNVTYIDYWAFQGCSGLTSITIPASVTSIKEETFTDCNNLTSVNYEGTLEQWLNISFYGFDSNPLYYAHHLYINDSEVTDLVIPEGVTSIGNYAFIGCYGLTSITIPDSVTNVGYEMCCDCINLSSITLPGNVPKIWEGAFRGCSALTSITIPDTVTSIEGKAFLKCSGLTSIIIPDSVTSIGEWAFRKCSGLTSVTIGNGVTSIGEWAFSDCNNLTTVNYCGSAEQWAAINFGSDNTALTGATINYNYTGE